MASMGAVGLRDRDGREAPGRTFEAAPCADVEPSFCARTTAESAALQGMRDERAARNYGTQARNVSHALPAREAGP